MEQQEYAGERNAAFGQPSGREHPRRVYAVLFVGAWGLMVAAGMVLLAAYANSASPILPAPAQLDSAFGAQLDAGRLLMFVHPRCPCSSASVNELARIMATCSDQLEATVYFVRPASQREGWEQSRLWNLAASIPGVTVRVDAGGVLARRFNANTSGETIVYDRHGKLCFQGGVTASRGHEGDNRGESAVIALAKGNQADVQCSPVFGCPLFAESGRSDD